MLPQIFNPRMRRFVALVFVNALLICRAIPNPFGIAAASMAGEAPALPTSLPTERAAIDQLIPWLLEEDRQLRGIAFSEVILDRRESVFCQSIAIMK
jgi:hypothetical protein